MVEPGVLSVDDLIAEAVELVREGDAARARVFASQALSLAPESAAAHHAMGLVELSDLRQSEARSCFSAALAREPDNADFLVSFAYADITAGDFAEARTKLRRALDVNPASAAAYQNLSWITRAAPGDPLIDAMRKLISRTAEGGEDYIRLAYALGKCLDDAGDYDAAFDWYERANYCQPSHYDTTRHERFFTDVKRVFTSDFIAARSVEGYRSDMPIFIIGMPRSGSTLLEEKLCARPGVVGLGEIGDIIKMSNAMTAAHPRRAVFPDWCADGPPGAIGGLGRFYVGKHAGAHPDALRVVNKALLNFAYAGMIATMLPDALIVETRRNPIDTCLSCFFKDLKRIHHYAVRLETLGHAYRLYADIMAHWKETLPKLVTVEYERFIEDADGAAAALLEKSGVAETESSTGPAAPRHVQTFSAWQVKQPVYKHAVARWRNYEKHLQPLIDALGDLAET